MTWCNKREGDARIYCKLDHVLVNKLWMQELDSSHAQFLTYGSSDHAPALVSLEIENEYKPRPFRFCNMWAKHQQFLPCVAQAWSKQFNGCPMYVFMRKQKEKKAVLKRFHKDNFSGLSERIQEAHMALVKVQNLLSTDLFNTELVFREKELLEDYRQLMKADLPLAA